MVLLEGKMIEKVQTIVDDPVEAEMPDLSLLTCIRCWECARDGHRYQDT